MTLGRVVFAKCLLWCGFVITRGMVTVGQFVLAVLALALLVVVIETYRARARLAQDE